MNVGAIAKPFTGVAVYSGTYHVERAFGEPLNVYTRKHIFTPLQMARTGWILSEVDRSNHFTLVVSQNGHIIPIPLYSGTTYPDGGVRTSVADLSRFFIALLNGGQYQGARILDAAGAAEMQRFQFTDANRPENFPAADGNSGLFWRTTFNGQRVGVILFLNTSLSGADQRASNAIFDALWTYGESLRARARQSPFADRIEPARAGARALRCGACAYATAIAVLLHVGAFTRREASMGRRSQASGAERAGMASATPRLAMQSWIGSSITRTASRAPHYAHRITLTGASLRKIKPTEAGIPTPE